MAFSGNKYLLSLFLSVLLLTASHMQAQQPGTQPSAHPSQQPGTPPAAAPQNQSIVAVDTIGPKIPEPVYGPYDTIRVPAKVYQGELLSAHNMPYTFVTRPMPPAMRRRMEEWTRLRNAVYVTYPYARKAGIILNDISAHLALLNTDKEREAYVKSREKELKKEFTQPLEQMSVYQGKILMKLINRQSGNNCYNIIKDYKGGFTARFWQTVAFFFGSSLKQPYDPKGEDRDIETIVQEVERMYHG